MGTENEKEGVFVYSGEEAAFFVASTAVLLKDVAKAMCVQDGSGETYDHAEADQKAVMHQDAKDVLDRAFRYARERVTP